MMELIGLFVGIIGAVVAVLMFRLEKRRDRTADQGARMQAANGVSAWPIRYPGEPKERFGVQVRNAGDAPIFDVRLSTSTGYRQVYAQDLFLNLVPPGDMVFTNASAGKPGWDGGQRPESIAGLKAANRNPYWKVLGIRFRDGSGQWWAVANGAPQRCDAKAGGDAVVTAAKQAYRAEMAAKKVQGNGAATA